MNTVFLIGRLVKEPEVRYTQTQKSYVRFTLAVDRDYRDDDGKRPTDFIRCAVWSNSALYLEKYACKGSRIAIRGSLQTSSWQNEDGKMSYNTEVVCDRVSILDFAKRNSKGRRGPKEKKDRQETRWERPDSSFSPGTFSPSDLGSGYEVYTPPGFDEMDDNGDLPF